MLRAGDHYSGLPVMHSLFVSDVLEPKSPIPHPPSSFPSEVCSEGCIQSLNSVLFVILIKWERVFCLFVWLFFSVRLYFDRNLLHPRAKHAQKIRLIKTQCGCALGSSACCQFSYIPYIFRHCDLWVLKIFICQTSRKENEDKFFYRLSL